MPVPAVSLTWREARAALTESGRDVNGAQLILDDLAHWGPGASRFSYKAGEGEIRWLSYAGTDGDHQPRYLSSPNSALRANRAGAKTVIRSWPGPQPTARGTVTTHYAPLTERPPPMPRPEPIDASGVGSYWVLPGKVVFTTYVDPQHSARGCEVNVCIDTADTAFLLCGLVEAFGAGNVRDAVHRITRELEGDAWLYS